MGPDALHSCYPSPTSLQFPDSFMETSEYTTAPVKPFFTSLMKMKCPNYSFKINFNLAYKLVFSSLKLSIVE